MTSPLLYDIRLLIFLLVSFSITALNILKHSNVYVFFSRKKTHAILISLQGKSPMVEVIAEDFSVKILEKKLEKPPLQPPLMIVDVLMEIITNIFYN